MVEVIHIGDQRSGDEVVKGIRELEPAIDTFGLIPTSALIHLHMDPPGPVPGKGEHHVAMATLPAEAIDAFVAANGADSGSDILTAEIRHLGGAIARPDASHGAAHIDAEYISFAASMAASPDMAAKAEQDLAGMDEALEPFSSARRYLNFAEAARSRASSSRSPRSTGCAPSRRRWIPTGSSGPTSRSTRRHSGDSPHSGGRVNR